jgi:hypothetical protein
MVYNGTYLSTQNIQGNFIKVADPLNPYVNLYTQLRRRRKPIEESRKQLLLLNFASKAFQIYVHPKRMVEFILSNYATL